MPVEKNKIRKKKNTKKILTATVSSAGLLGGIAAGVTPVNIETEAKIEENEKLNNKIKVTPATGNQSVIVNQKINLAKALPPLQRNLGTIITNDLPNSTIQAIKSQLIKKNIDISQVTITKVTTTTALIKPIINSIKYQGEVKVSYLLKYFLYINKSENIKLDLPNFGISIHSQNYYYSKIDLTALYGYHSDEWEQIKQKFKTFSFNDIVISLKRNDNNGEVVKTGKIVPFDLSRMNYAHEFNEDIENRKYPHVVAGVGANASYPTMQINEMPFGFSSYYQVIFKESLPYHASISTVSVSFSLQKYIKNDHLMLRMVFNVTKNSFGSFVGLTLNIKINDLKLGQL